MPASAVRWFHSGMSGAPVLSGAAGALIAVLDACLKDGFDTRTINTLTVSGGVATATISAGHVYDVHAVIRIEGVTGALAALNDDWRVASVTGSTLTFPCPGVADGSATGTITCKRAPAGWGKPFAATNKAVYQSANLASTRLFLRVDDALAQYTRVRGYEQMSDIDTGTGLFPTLAQLVATNFTWGKSTVADGSPRAWVLVADDQFVYFLPRGAPTGLATLLWFGDVAKLLPSDAYHCTLAAQESATPSLPGGSIATSAVNDTAAAGGQYFARASSQSGAAIAFVKGGVVGLNFGAGNVPSSSPGLDGRQHFQWPVLARDGGATAPIRGVMPGIMQVLHQSPAERLTPITVDAVTLIVVAMRAGTASDGACAIDIIGPWR